MTIVGVSVCTLHGISLLHVFGHSLNFFLHNGTIVSLLCSFLQWTSY